MPSCLTWNNIEKPVQTKKKKLKTVYDVVLESDPPKDFGQCSNVFKGLFPNMTDFGRLIITLFWCGKLHNRLRPIAVKLLYKKIERC